MSNPHHNTKQHGRWRQPPDMAALIAGALTAGLLALLTAVLFVWGAIYCLQNTPFLGQFATPPVPSVKFIGTLTCFSVPLGFLAALISFVCVREAIR